MPRKSIEFSKGGLRREGVPLLRCCLFHPPPPYGAGERGRRVLADCNSGSEPLQEEARSAIPILERQRTANKKETSWAEDIRRRGER